MEASPRFVGSEQQKKLSWASIDWYMRDKQRVTVSSNSRF